MTDFTVDASSHIPAYKQIEDFLKAGIKAGGLKPYSKVWSERTMADQFKVSRMTARRAVSNLIGEGYLFAQEGKGTFVSDKRIDLPVFELKNFVDEMKALNKTPSAKILSHREFPANRNVAKDLSISAGTKIFQVRRLMSGDGVPYVVETKCVIHKKCKLLQESGGKEGELIEVLSGRCHQCVTKFDIVIEATFLNEEEAELLQIAKPIPAFCIKKYAYDSTGERISFTKSIYRGDLYRFRGTAEY
jgi:GntR family transcriptional regulator, N-acetylglucosamine utilization regulator